VANRERKLWSVEVGISSIVPLMDVEGMTAKKPSRMTDVTLSRFWLSGCSISSKSATACLTCEDMPQSK